MQFRKLFVCPLLGILALSSQANYACATEAELPKLTTAEIKAAAEVILEDASEVIKKVMESAIAASEAQSETMGSVKEDTTPVIGEDATATILPEEKPSPAVVKALPSAVAENANPYAQAMIENMHKEIVDGLVSRKITTKFSTFEAFARRKLEISNRPRTGTELTGNCRLDWLGYLLGNPLESAGATEKFSSSFHAQLNNQEGGLLDALAASREKLDFPPRTKEQQDRLAVSKPSTPSAVVKALETAITNAETHYAKAISGLNEKEHKDLVSSAASIFVTNNRVGFTLRSKKTGRYLLNLLELKVDRIALLDATDEVANLADRRFVEQLKKLPFSEELSVIETPVGKILLGTTNDDTFALDTLTDVVAVVDPGGNDLYQEGTVSPERPVLLVFDLAGHDVYRGSKSGIQGSAVMGISMLVDLEGDDQYLAKDIAQGSCIGGAGLLIDFAGDDRYEGYRFMQGAAQAGIGLVVDHGGDDKYKAAMMAQGLGRPIGIGVINDKDGTDSYFCGGYYINSYINDDESPTPGYEGWGQGIGTGIRSVSSGGIGMCLDGGGDDTYESGYFSLGGGYWCGIGIARDFGGNDQRLGGTRVAYSGRPRSQRNFVRFNNGFGCHYAVGYSIDDSGNDTYKGTIMCLGFAWDCATAYLLDFGGDDYYRGTQGQGKQASLGVLYDFDGADTHYGSSPGYASSGISYHSMPYCGGNFSFVIDHGGIDKYRSRYIKNNSYKSRGRNGFAIDRPTEEEMAEMVRQAKLEEEKRLQAIAEKEQEIARKKAEREAKIAKEKAERAARYEARKKAYEAQRANRK